MDELYDYRQRLLERYETITEDLERVLRQVHPQDWHRSLEPGSWSPHQILAHIRDAGVHEFFPCIRNMLGQVMTSIDCFDREAWMAAHYNPDEPPEAIWSEFHRLHAAYLEQLRELPSAGWSRSGRHPTWGMRTLQWWVEQSLAHIEEHLRQLKSEE
jgi:hypothetical protein